MRVFDKTVGLLISSPTIILFVLLSYTNVTMASSNFNFEWEFIGFTRYGLEASSWVVVIIIGIASVAIIIAFLYTILTLFIFLFKVMRGVKSYNDSVFWKKFGVSLMLELSFMAGLLWLIIEKIYVNLGGIAP